MSRVCPTPLEYKHRVQRLRPTYKNSFMLF